MPLQEVTHALVRLIDSCITQLKAQGPSRTCNEGKEEELGGAGMADEMDGWMGVRVWSVRFRVEG